MLNCIEISYMDCTYHQVIPSSPALYLDLINNNGSKRRLQKITMDQKDVNSSQDWKINIGMNNKDITFWYTLIIRTKLRKFYQSSLVWCCQSQSRALELNHLWAQITSMCWYYLLSFSFLFLSYADRWLCVLCVFSIHFFFRVSELGDLLISYLQSKKE